MRESRIDHQAHSRADEAYGSGLDRCDRHAAVDSTPHLPPDNLDRQLKFNSISELPVQKMLFRRVRAASKERKRCLKTSEILGAWRKILKGERPSLSIEITRECPLRCPGCYAYDEAHLGGGVTLRALNDRKGQELIDGVLDIVDRYKPLHLSIVGGDPLVRYRELDVLLPQLVKRTHGQVVTSAFRQIPSSLSPLPNLRLVVSIDGLQPEHDVRRKPATYERIL